MNKQTRKQVYDKFAGHCAYCGCELTYEDMHVDHIQPKLRGMNMQGGNDDISNYYPSCPACNIRKSTFTVEEFRAELEACHDRMIRSSANYRQLVRYGQIKLINNGKVIFYFEKHESNRTNDRRLGMS